MIISACKKQNINYLESFKILCFNQFGYHALRWCCIICDSFRPGNSSQPIWSTNMSSSSSDTCHGTSNSCPSTSLTSCNHTEDVTVTCSKFSC